jgi:hypothetical protein
MPKGLVVQLEIMATGERNPTDAFCLLAISDRCQRTFPLLIRG